MKICFGRKIWNEWQQIKLSENIFSGTLGQMQVIYTVTFVLTHSFNIGASLFNPGQNIIFFKVMK